VKERERTVGRVIVAGRVAHERLRTDGGIGAGVGVATARERSPTDGRVVVGGRVAKERFKTQGRVSRARCVWKGRLTANGDIANAVGILLERLSSNSCVLLWAFARNPSANDDY